MHNKQNTSIAVLGATGAQGGPVVDALLRAGRPVRAIARTPSKLAPLEARGAEVRAIDLADEAALTDALSGVAGVIAHLPFVPLREVLLAQATALATALRRAEVPITAFTTSGPVPGEEVGVASADARMAAVEVLRGTDIPMVSLIPTAYLDNLSAPFTAPSLVTAGELRYPLPADHRQAWISTEDQAALLIAALDHPELAGEEFAVGHHVTGPEIAAAIQDGRGRPATYVAIDPVAFGASVAPFMGEAVGDELARDYAVMASRPAALGLDNPTGELEARLGLALTLMHDWAAAQPWDVVAASVGA